MEQLAITISDVLAKIGECRFTELSANEELAFYREIIHSVGAFLYINQIEDLADFSTAHCVWANQRSLDKMGYTMEEVQSIGARLWEETIHPDDKEVTTKSIDFHSMKQGDSFCGVVREITKDRQSLWFMGCCVVLQEKNGVPWQFLNVAINIQDDMEAQKQLLYLKRENLRLMQELTLSKLGKREREVLKLIALGRTTRKIASELHISPETVRTHRKNMQRKLSVQTIAELAVIANQAGII